MQITTKINAVKRKGKRLHWGDFKVPANHVRLTKAERREDHKARMKARRRQQLARQPGFTHVPKA